MSQSSVSPGGSWFLRRPTAPAALAAVVLASGLLAACGGGGAAAPGGPAFPPPEVTVVAVAPATVPVQYELSGRLEGSREVEVRARVSGILLERRYAEGRPVRRGDLLFLIDPAPYQAAVQEAEADLAEQRARLSRAEREARRLEPLLAKRAASQKDYDQAVSDAEEAAATLLSAEARLARAKLDLSYTRVEAPIGGITSRAEHSEGSLVGPGADSLLTRISQVEPIWVRFSAADKTILDLRREVEAGRLEAPPTDRLEVELVLADGRVHPERGRVNFSDSLIDVETGAVDLRAEIANAENALLPGQFVRVRLLGISRPQAIVVPQRAVQQGQQGKFVFVVDASGKAEARPVEVGEWVGQDWVIVSGLAAGDRVIVDGAVKVQPGAEVRVATGEAG
jgi:membrane fusion protein (multidrug efflux system)